MKLRVKEGYKIRDPRSQRVIAPNQPFHVKKDDEMWVHYWARRIKEGSCEEVSEQVESAPKPKRSKSQAKRIKVQKEAAKKEELEEQAAKDLEE